MAFQAVPDTAEINIIYTVNGVTLQNVLYAEYPGGYVIGNLVALAAQVDVQVAGTWLAQQVTEAAYIRTEVRGLAVENDLMVSDNTSAGIGVITGGALPNNVTLAVKKESGFTGRSARGRLYWIGLPRNFLDTTNENIVVAINADAIVAAVDSQRIGINALPIWVPVLVSRVSGGAERTVGVTFPWISSVAVDNRVDTQRTRMS